MFLRCKILLINNNIKLTWVVTIIVLNILQFPDCTKINQENFLYNSKLWKILANGAIYVATDFHFIFTEMEV